jgi:transcriptional regulator with XRE-family HTH domain
MLAVQYGNLIRKARIAKGMTQSELALAARVSRTILSKIEQGKPSPVQTDVLDRTLQALNITASVGADSAIEDRRRARAEQQVQLDQQRSRHLRLAVELASNPLVARTLIAKAKVRVQLWKQNKTCSPYYIKRWSAILELPPRELARKIAALGKWEDALFQNSPWSSAWT